MSYTSMGSWTPSERKYARIKQSYSRREQAEAWVNDLQPPDTMDDPSASPEAIERAFEMPFIGRSEVEKIMYKGPDPYGGDSTHFESFYHDKMIDVPLALMRRYETEQTLMGKQDWENLCYPKAPMPKGEMVRRRWEQALSSRLPPIEKPEAVFLGKPLCPWVTASGRYYEERFIVLMLSSLKLLGGPENHPSENIRLPRALAESKEWQDFAWKQAHHYANQLQDRNEWVPFLLTRPFVVFQVISDAERRDRGWTQEMVKRIWKEKGYWIGGRWSEDAEGPGWTWPCEDPVYFLDDFVATWELSELWPGDPKAASKSRKAPEPVRVTEIELQNDPSLSQRLPDWKRQERLSKQREARRKAAEASAVSERNIYVPSPELQPWEGELEFTDDDMMESKSPDPGCDRGSAQKDSDTQSAELIPKKRKAGAQQRINTAKKRRKKGSSKVITTKDPRKMSKGSKKVNLAKHESESLKSTGAADDLMLPVPARPDNSRRSSRLAGHPPDCNLHM